MMKRLTTVATVFAPGKVEAAIKALKADDPDWDYRADFDPKGTGKARIGVYDEDGEFIEWWGS